MMDYALYAMILVSEVVNISVQFLGYHTRHLIDGSGLPMFSRSMRSLVASLCSIKKDFEKSSCFPSSP